MKLATPEQMQSLDRAAMEELGIPGLVLMENAGRATLDQMEAQFGPVLGKSVCLFIGPGNNGGDGLVIARHVLQRGGVPLLVFLIEPEQLRGDAAVNAGICAKLWLTHYIIRQEAELPQLLDKIRQLHFTQPVHSLVDALFGIGLSRKLEGCFAAVVRLINELAQQQHWPVVAVDIPSGLSAQTGMPLGCSVEADLTVTYGLAKPGQYLHGGAAVGKLKVADIGIPEQLVAAAKLPGQLLEQRGIAALLRPRAKAAHKGSFGHLLILAGSEGKTGAALLAAKAALRSGCGLVTLAVPKALNPIFATALPEVMTVPLPGSDSYLSAADYEQITNLLADKDALVIGPGIGLAPETGELVLRLHRRVHLPIVLDADALNLLAQNTLSIADAAGPRLLTPHPGEMARLTGLRTTEIQADRLKAADWLAEAEIRDGHEIITVLKGAGTVICSSKGGWAVNSSGNNGLAVGGTGDVLAGFIGGLLAQGYIPWEAAAIGVFLHGLAADLLAQKQQHGFTAGELAAALPWAISTLQQK
ncbi:NAD(P)H-hydrate dehydratase [Candidatus Electronema sp. PJ]|uniref:NAD(P)H-hydrate dehydratase n=1 Tax=Candidatus Electronema sp. PJ TaxID=3401572 RepID=UPI003AA93367